MRVVCFALMLLAAACGPREPRVHQLRLYSTSYNFTIISDPSPPRAREKILYKVVIHDRRTRQPIETGEGQVYATNIEHSNTWDGFEKGPEVGTYYGRLNYVTSGLWAVAIRFRRDSLHPLEKVEWAQDVYNERGEATSR